MTAPSHAADGARLPASGPSAPAAPQKQDADYVFYELTRSICPACRRPIDAQVLLRDDKVYLRKRCREHGQVDALVYADAEAYVRQAKFNKPGTIPLACTSEIQQGYPHDCGLRPAHQQHACLGIIEVQGGRSASPGCPGAGTLAPARRQWGPRRG